MNFTRRSISVLALSCLAFASLSGCWLKARRTQERELTESRLITYPDEPSLPQGAIARLGNRSLHLDGQIRAMTLDPVERFLIASDGGRLEIFEPDTGVKERAILPHVERAQPSDMRNLNFARSNKHLIGLTSDVARGLMVWSMPDRRLLYSLPASKAFGGLVTTAASRADFASISRDGELVIRGLQDGKPLMSVALTSTPSKLNTYTGIYFTPQDDRILLLRRDGWELRDATSGEVVLRQDQPRAVYIGAAFFPDGKRAAMVRSAGSQVEIWDMVRGERIGQIDFKQGIRRLGKVVVDPTSNTILVQTTGTDPALLGLNESDGELFRVSSQDFAVSAEGLIAISSGRSLRRYRMGEDGQLMLVEKVAGHATAPTQFAWDEAGDVLWSSSPEGTIVRWDLTTRTGEFFDADLVPGPLAMALDPRSSGIVVAGGVRGQKTSESLLRWMDRRTGELIWSAPLIEPLTHVKVLGSGDVLAVSISGVVTRFNAYGAAIQRWPLGSEETQVSALNENGTRLVVFERGIKKARYWDVESGFLMGSRRFPGSVSCAWYKQYTAACARDRGVGSMSFGSLWYSSEIATFSHGFQHIRGMAFSLLGDRLAVWGRRPSRFDSADQVWFFDAALSDTDPMLDPMVLEPRDGSIQSAKFHPDARRFVTGHDSGLIYLWDLGGAKTVKLR